VAYLSSKHFIIELSLLLQYSLGRAYQISLRNKPTKQKGKGAYLAYGETPLSTFNTILSRIPIKSGLQFAELGCGIGRLSLMSAHLHQFNVTGVDLIEPFVSYANKLAKRHKLNCTFLHCNILDIDWSKFDLLYITATTYSEEILDEVWNKATEIKKDAILITLTHSPPKQDFSILDMKILPFSWGIATVYISRRL
jgi:SAM-dependent methyltransferase